MAPPAQPSADSSEIQLAAEALQSLRSSSSSNGTSHPPSSSAQDSYSRKPPTCKPAATAHNATHTNHHSSGIMANRSSPYHSRSSSVSSSASFAPANLASVSVLSSASAYNSPAASPPVLSSALASPTIGSPDILPQQQPSSAAGVGPSSQIKLPSIDSAVFLSTPSDPSAQAALPPTASNPKSANKRKLTPAFLNPLVSSAAKIYEQSKSYSPRFRYSAEKLESVISSRMNTNAPKPTLPPLRASDKTLAPLNNPYKQNQQQEQTGEKPPVKKRQRSTWQGMLVTASSIATSLSSDNKQRLRYCLHLLKLANTHIATKVNQLQEILQEERAAALAQSIAANHVPTTPGSTGPAPNNNKTARNAFLTQKVNSIKRDIVWTIRKVVSALSTYAGNSLPEPARTHVRNYILRLPARWASSLSASNPVSGTSTRCSTPGAAGTGSNTPTIESMLSPVHTNSTTTSLESKNQHRSSSSSRTLSGSFSPKDDSTPPFIPSDPSSVTKNETSNNGDDLTPSTSVASSQPNTYNSTTLNYEERQRIHSDAEIGNRVLSLATEALEMLGSIIAIVDETLERAEIWCDRFGRVGLASGRNQPQQQQGTEDASGSATEGTNKSVEQGSGLSTSVEEADSAANSLKQRTVVGSGEGFKHEDVEMSDR